MHLTRQVTATHAAQLLLTGAVLFMGLGACAQTLPVPGAALPAAKSTSNLPNRPLWTDLSESQQQALSPLAQLWPSMNEPHKRKWLAVSQSFASLSPDEQSTVQGRMREWAALSAQQRSAARLNFAGAQQLPQEDKKAKWEAYQALSPEAKQKFAAQQPTPMVGAAPAVKPVASAKLTTPPTASTNKSLPRIATDKASPTTLLPNLVNTTSSPASPTSESAAVPQ
jgi:hypothetical protein